MPNKKNPLSSYYNYPKLYGEAPPEERWHSDPSEQGMIPPWLSNVFSRKDQFGFGSSQPVLDTKEIMKKTGEVLDAVFTTGQIDQDEYKRLYELVQSQIQQQEKSKGMLERFVDHQTNIPYRNLRTGKEEIMER